MATFHSGPSPDHSGRENPLDRVIDRAKEIFTLTEWLEDAPQLMLAIRNQIVFGPGAEGFRNAQHTERVGLTELRNTFVPILAKAAAFSESIAGLELALLPD